MNGLAIFSGNANLELAKAICGHLNVSLTNVLVARFSEGETRVEIKENIRGKDVFIIQPTSPPPNENLMELLVLIDAARRASADRITAVLPYYGYARQDRKDQPRVPITAKLVANLIVAAGAGRVLTMDLHANQIQGFFDIPLDHLFAVKTLTEYIQSFKLKDLVIVSPDVGGIKTARAYAKRLNAGLAIVDKRRIDDEKAEVMHVMGNVKGKHAVIVDDMVSTAGSLVEAVEAIKKNGARDVYAAITHPVLCGPAMERIKKSSLKQLVVTDTIALGSEKRPDNIKVLSVAPLLAEAIKRIHEEESVSGLFN